jgi:hypothetical protein
MCCAHGAEQRYVRIQTQFEHVDHFGRDANRNRIEKHWNFYATTVVGKKEWRIDNNYAKNAEITWFFDGTDLYYTFHSTSPSLIDNKDQAPYILPAEASNSPSEVLVTPLPDGVPLANAGVTLPWLAFCSGNYLKRDGRIMPIPIGLPTPDAFGYSDKTETFDDEFGLPKRVDLYTSKALYKASMINFNKKHLGGRDVAFLENATYRTEDGILKFHYGVTASTNYLGWNFPLKFEYQIYKAWTNGNWVVDYSGKGTVTAIGDSGAPDHPVDPTQAQRIVYRR